MMIEVTGDIHWLGTQQLAYMDIHAIEDPLLLLNILGCSPTIMPAGCKAKANALQISNPGCTDSALIGSYDNRDPGVITSMPFLDYPLSSKKLDWWGLMIASIVLFVMY